MFSRSSVLPAILSLTLAPVVSTTGATPPAVPQYPAAHASWGFSRLAPRLGTPGIFTLETGDAEGPRTEVFAAMETYWAVMRWNAEAKTFVPRYMASAEANYPRSTFEPTMKTYQSFLPGQITGDAMPEVIVGYTDATVDCYDARTGAKVRSLVLRTEARDKALQAMAVADLDGDGTVEIISASPYTLAVHDAEGRLLWSVAAEGIHALAVGQVDADAAPEIVCDDGTIYDSARHSVQWNRPAAWREWRSFQLADVNGDGRAEVVAVTWDFTTWRVEALDISKRRQLWEIDRQWHPVTSLLMGNLDDDAGLELAVGDADLNQALYDVDAEGTAVKWSRTTAQVAGPMTCGDLTGEGTRSLLWGPYSGSDVGASNSSGPYTGPAYQTYECLRTETREQVAAAETRQRLEGPFLAPRIGDVTGDGVPEIVTASNTSSARLQGGRMVILDGTTRVPLLTSEPLLTKLTDLRLRDLDGDGTLEIIVTGVSGVAASDRGAGRVRCYQYDAATHGLSLYRELAQPSAEIPWRQAEIVDVDGNGVLKVVCMSGPRLTVLDLATGAVEWQSEEFSSLSNGATCLEVGDVDGDGNLEAVCGGFYGAHVLDLKTRTNERGTEGAVALALDPAHQRFYIGNETKVSRYTATGPGQYVMDHSFQVPHGVKGLRLGTDGGLWIVGAESIGYWPDGNGPSWSAEQRYGQAAGPPALLWTEAGMEMYVAFNDGLCAFETEPAPGTLPNVRIALTGPFAEGAVLQQGSLEVGRDTPGETDLVVRFRLAGTATAADVAIAGAVDLGDGVWGLTIPAGALYKTAAITVVDDSLNEGAETLGVVLEGAATYNITPPGTAMLPITDDDGVAKVSVTALRPYVEETPGARTAPQAGWVLERTGGDLTKALTVKMVIGGTATNGTDYRKLAATYTIPARKSSLTIPLVPITDALAESAETIWLGLDLNGGPGYIPAPGREYDRIDLWDSSSVVSIDPPVVTPRGVEVTFSRMGAIHKAQTVSITETRVTDGNTVRSTRRITFRSGASTAVYAVRAGAKAFSDGIVLVPDASYTPGVRTSVAFEVAR